MVGPFVTALQDKHCVVHEVEDVSLRLGLEERLAACVSNSIAAVQLLLEMRRLDPAGKEHPPDAYVFGNEVGERAKSIRQAWKNTCRRAGITGLRFHDLRREFASRLLESGAPAHEVRDWLGHSNITTTSRYLATTRIALQKARQRFEQHRPMPVEQPPSGKLPTANARPN